MSFKAYDEYKDSGVEWLGEVPAHWSLKKFKHTARIKNGRDYKDVEVSSDGYPVIGSGGEFSRASHYLYAKESVLLGRKGTIDKPIYLNTPFWTVDTMFYTEIKKETSSKYLYYYAKCFQYDMYSTNTALPSMAQEDLNNIHLASPMIKEQTTIAAFLDHETARIDALIEEQQRLIALLKEKRQAVISHAVTKGLDPNMPMKDSGVEWLGEVPAHWEVARIKFIAKLESGHTPSKDFPEYWSGNIPWISLNDSKYLKDHDYISSTKFNITELGIKKSSARLLPDEAVIFTRDATIGLTAITQGRMAVSQHIIAWICKVEKTSPEFLLFSIYAMQQELERYTFGATIKTIGMPDINKLTIALPTMKEQRLISEHVISERESIDKLISESEKTIGLFLERRSALISAAVTGKIDVRDWQPPKANQAAEPAEISA